ncbi:MAG: glycosyltransferase family 39 protein [Rhodospirillaceae bacterium]
MVLLIGATPARFAAVLAVYVAALMALRLALFPGGSDDDAEILYYTQSWAFAYKSGQPPLYAWIVMAAESILGPTMAAVAIVKYAALGLFYWFAYKAAGRLLKSGLFAALAPLGLMACFFIGWEAAVNYSHTILLMAAMAATTWLTLRLEDHARPLNYLMLGAAIAVGLLAKFNFLLFLVPFVLAAAMHGPLRGRVMSAPFWLMLAGAAAVAALPLNLGQTIQSSAPDLARVVGADGWRAAAVARGLWQFALSSLGLLTPFIVISVALFPRAFGRLPAWDDGLGAVLLLLEIYLITLTAVCVIVIVATGAADVRNNWLVVWFPAVFYVLLRIKIYVESREGADVARRFRLFSGVLLLIALAIPLGMALRAATAPDACRKCNFFIPYAAIAAKVRKAGFMGGTIIAQDWPNQLAGNLRRYFPDSRAISTRWRDYTPPGRDKAGGQTGGKCLLIWRGDAKAGGEVRDEALKRPGISVPAATVIHRVSLPTPRAKNRKIAWTYMIVENAGC